MPRPMSGQQSQEMARVASNTQKELAAATREFSRAINDIRQTVVEEGWFGKSQTGNYGHGLYESRGFGNAGHSVSPENQPSIHSQTIETYAQPGSIHDTHDINNGMGPTQSLQVSAPAQPSAFDQATGGASYHQASYGQEQQHGIDQSHGDINR